MQDETPLHKFVALTTEQHGEHPIIPQNWKTNFSRKFGILIWVSCNFGGQQQRQQKPALKVNNAQIITGL